MSEIEQSEIEQFLAHLKYDREYDQDGCSRSPDSRRRGQFQAGWEDWTVRERKYLPQTLRSLTWHNLGYRFARKFGKSTRDEIRRVYKTVASLKGG